MKEELVIKVESVSKKFKLNSADKSFEKSKEFYALKNINLKAKKGDCIGIIGPNGSGKTTLLRLIGGLLRPSKGKIYTSGEILTFLDLGGGFNEYISGRENIFLYGAMLGIRKKKLEKNLKRIIEFSDLEKFIDAKLKDYSTGMRLRLAFTIAMVSNPEILLIDEVLGVGDHGFQKKSYDKIRFLKSQGVTIVLASHDLSAIEDICDYAIFIDQGSIKMTGKSEEVTGFYKSYFKSKQVIKKHLKVEKKLLQLNELDKKINELKNQKIPKWRSYLNKNESKIVKLSKQRLDMLSELSEIIQETIYESYNNIVDIVKSDSKVGKKEKKEQQEHIKRIKKIIEIKDKFFPDWVTIEEIELMKKLLLWEFLFIDNEKRASILKELSKTFGKAIRNTKRSELRNKYLDEYLNFLSNLDIRELNKESIKQRIEDFLDIAKEEGYFDKMIGAIESKIAKNYLSQLEKESEILKNKLRLEPKIKNRKIFQNRINEIDEFKKYLIKKFLTKHLPKKEYETSEILQVLLLNKENKQSEFFTTSDNFKIKITCKLHKPKSSIIGISIFKNDGFSVAGMNTDTSKYSFEPGKPQDIFCEINNLPLLEGNYFLSVSIHSNKDPEPFAFHDKRYSFKVITPNYNSSGVYHIKNKWYQDN